MHVSSPTTLQYSTQAPIANECMVKFMSTQWKLPPLPMSPLLLLNLASIISTGNSVFFWSNFLLISKAKVNQCEKFRQALSIIHQEVNVITSLSKNYRRNYAATKISEGDYFTSHQRNLDKTQGSQCCIWSAVLVYFCCCCYDKTLAENSLKRKGSTRLPHPCHNPAQKEDKVRTEAETMEKHCLMGCVHGLLSLFSSATQEQLPRRGTAHRGFGTPTSTMKQENSPQKY